MLLWTKRGQWGQTKFCGRHIRKPPLLRVVMCPAAASNLSRECKHLLRLAKRRGKAKEKANVDDDDDDQGCRFATALSLEVGGRKACISINQHSKSQHVSRKVLVHCFLNIQITC